jgi:hypothetical protein
MRERFAAGTRKMARQPNQKTRKMIAIFGKPLERD